MWSVLEALVLTFLLVLARLVVRRRTPAAVVAGVLWLTPDVLGAFLAAIAAYGCWAATPRSSRSRHGAMSPADLR